MRTQRICLFVLSLGLYKLCCTQGDSSRIMCITFLVELKRMVCHISPLFFNQTAFDFVPCFLSWITYFGRNIPLFCFKGKRTPYSWTCFVGTGAVYSFDPVGSYEREACRAAGAAQSLVQPFLDNQVNPLSPIYL